MEYDQFKQVVDSLKNMNKILSVTGKSYSHIKVEGDKVYYQRDDAESPTNREYIDLHILYKLYHSGKFTTTNARIMGLGGKQSPAVAIVRAISH